MTADRTPSHRPLQDPEAFARFYEESAQSVVRFFARRVGDPEVALDLTAETFAQAFRSRARCKTYVGESALPWVYTIAGRQLQHYFRKGRAETRALQRLGVEMPRPTSAELERVDELAGLHELRIVIDNELERLPATQRQAVRLRIVEERSYESIAHDLGISEQTARSRVSRALRGLASTLAPQIRPESSR